MIHPYLRPDQEKLFSHVAGLPGVQQDEKNPLILFFGAKMELKMIFWQDANPDIYYYKQHRPENIWLPIGGLTKADFSLKQCLEHWKSELATPELSLLPFRELIALHNILAYEP